MTLYVAGPDEIRGNGTRSYLEAYPHCKSEAAAAVGASRLLRRDRVRARARELREEAAQAAKARLRSWWELAPDAQRTLVLATRGELRFPEAGPKVEGELIRSAVRAATELLDRALGTAKQMHEEEGGREPVVILVAGPGGELAPLGAEVEGEEEEDWPALPGA